MEQTSSPLLNKTLHYVSQLGFIRLFLPSFEKIIKVANCPYKQLQ